MNPPPYRPEPLSIPQVGCEPCADCGGLRYCLSCAGVGFHPDGRRCEWCQGDQQCCFCAGAGQVLQGKYPPPHVTNQAAF